MWGREPAVIMGLVSAAIALGVGFGLPVTPAQVGLTMAFVSAILAFVVRAQVVPTEVANRQIEIGIASPTNTPVEKVIEKAAKEANV